MMCIVSIWKAWDLGRISEVCTMQGMFQTHWDKLRLFHQIAKAGGFNAASETLNISQPALSRSIQILENHLQMKLFERHPSGLKLTRRGEIIFDTIDRMVSELAQTQITLEDEELVPKGSLRIAATSGFASQYLTNILPEFLNQYPQIQLSIYGNDILPDLHSDVADALISPFIEDDDSLIQTYLTTFHLKLYASEDYLKNFGVPKTLTDLDQHRLLSYGDFKTPHPFPLANWHLSLGLKKGVIRQPYIMVNSAVGLFNLATNGMGIISISQEHPSIKDSTLIEVLSHVQGPTIDAYFIYSNRNRKIKRLSVLKKFLLHKFQDSLKRRETDRIIKKINHL